MAELTKLGKFEILSKVGQGAMGVVYKARDPLINRIVALKTLKPGLFEDSSLRRRFYAEARSAGNLRHPNIVTIYELGHEGDMPFIAMQFLQGESLDKVIDRSPNLPLSQRVGFMAYTCRALDHAHRQNPPVIHRDIKPANVVVGPDGSVVVVDFGIARIGDTSMSLSSGLLIGTLNYMAPQLFHGGTADAQSDIWAAGVMFYELLAYRRPFRGDHAAALMSNVVLEEPRPIEEAAPGTPEDVAKIIYRMLAKSVEERYHSMEEVLLDLEPVWKHLLHADIHIMLENSERLLNEGDLLAAKSEIVQILSWDSTNIEAKRVSDLINVELRKQKLIPEVRLHVENAERLLAEGHNEEARSEAQLALKLQSSYQPAAEIVRQAQAAIDQERKIRHALHASEETMAEGSLTEAERQLAQALALDPGNEEAQNRLKQIRDQRNRREMWKQRDSTMRRARMLWSNLQYEDCVNLLASLDKQFPNDAELLRFLDMAQRDQTEQRRQLLLVEIRNLLAAARFDDSLKLLEAFFERFPSDPTGNNLQAQALHGRDLQQCERRLNEGKVQLQTLFKQKDYDTTILQGKSLQREFPWDTELSELVIAAATEQTRLQQTRRLELLTGQIRELIKDVRTDEAIQTTEIALAEFPDELEVVTLAKQAQQQKAEKWKQQLIEQRVREAEKMLSRRHLTDALDLARQSIVTLGNDSRLLAVLKQAEEEIGVREQRGQKQTETVRNVHVLLSDGKLTDAALALKDAIESRLFEAEDPRIKVLFEEIAERRRPRADSDAASPPQVGAEQSEQTDVYSPADEMRVQAPADYASAPQAPVESDGSKLAGTDSQSDIRASTAVRESVDLKAIEKHLAFSIGPMARLLVERAAAKAKTAEELFAQIASTIPARVEREVFLGKKQEFLRIAPAKETAVGWEQSKDTVASADTGELNPENILKAAELAARYLGPVSKVLAARAAKRTHTLRGLYTILAEHLRGAERDRFLRDAGYPEL